MRTWKGHTRSMTPDDPTLAPDAGTPPEGGGADAQSLHDVLSAAYDGASAEPPAGDHPSPPGDASAASETPAAVPPGSDAGEPPSGGSPETPKAAEAPTQPAVEAPTHWASADREMFAKQTPEAQTWLLERHRSMEAAFTRNSQGIAPYREVAQKWDGYLTQLGVPAATAIDKLLSTEHTLRTGNNGQKLAMLRQLVTDYGISGPTEGGEAAQAPAQDPRYDQLNTQFQQMQASLQQQQHAAQEAQVARATREVEAFRDAKDDAGNLAHPYFADVEADMTRMAQADLAAGVQPDLRTLYERATWANPTVRGKLQAAQQEAAAAEARAKAEKARKAGGSISGAGAAPAEQPKGLRETLEAAWDTQAA